VLDLKIEGRRLRDWPLVELRRRHAHTLVDVLLTDQGRAALGAQHFLRALSVMFEDAITDEVADQNPWRGVSIRRTDPRVTKAARVPQVVSLDAAHRFAAAAGIWKGKRKPSPAQRADRARREGLVRVAADCGLRLGELLALERADLVRKKCAVSGCGVSGPHLHVRRTTHEGAVLGGTKHDHDRPRPGRIVPVPPSTLGVIDEAPPRLDSPLLFPTVTGKLWRERNFYRDVWDPARTTTNMKITPHDLRHSWISHMRAAGVDDADLAEMAGHTVATMLGTYSHALGKSFDQVRGVVG
jgi:integrase